MAQAKFDVIKPFSGGKGVSEWLEKVELVAKLTDVKDAANYIPLFLEGGPWRCIWRCLRRTG